MRQTASRRERMISLVLLLCCHFCYTSAQQNAMMMKGENHDELVSCVSSDYNDCSNDGSNEHVLDRETPFLVRELGLENFESFMDSSDLALVLLYDRVGINSREYKVARETLDYLAKTIKEMPSKDMIISFGQLDVRQHYALRRAYMADDDLELRDAYETVDSESFLNKHSTPIIPSQFCIFHDYKVVSKVKVLNKPFLDDPLHVRSDKLRGWLVRAIKATNNKATQSRNMKEAEESTIDNYFPFEQHFSHGGKSSLYNNRRTSIPPLEADNQGDLFFKYPALNDEIDFFHLQEVMNRYLAWCESYEVLWSSERKKVADEQLNYGPLLKQMNTRMRRLLTQGRVPDKKFELSTYFEDMVFGYGRSALKLEQYMNSSIFDKFGSDMSSINEIDLNEVALFNRIREIMYAQENGQDNDEFMEYFSSLVKVVHGILRDFHESITRFYMDFRKRNSEPGLQFALQKPDVLSMKDSANANILSNYDEFEKSYTAVGKPVIISDAQVISNDNVTKLLIDQCGSVDVTDNVRISEAIGDSSNTEWGGLLDFTLPKTLMNKQRLSDPNLRHRITLEQFLALSERIDGLYLHDFNVKDGCSPLFYSKSPYDSQQFVKLPYVLGGYDLAQKVVFSDFQVHPSLFVGKKGTNSKMHIDIGENGFIMYLVSGRKRWVTFKNSERPFVYERLTDVSVIPDALVINKSEKHNEYFDARFPLLRHSVNQSGAYELIQEPGQIVWIPPTMAHAVENLEDSIGLSFNIIPQAGLYRSMHCKIHNEQDFNQLDIMFRYLLFEQGGCRGDSIADRVDPLYTTLREYWAQCRK